MPRGFFREKPFGRAPLPGEDPVSIRRQGLHASPLAADLALDYDLMLTPVGRAAPDLHVPVRGVCDERETEREDGACLGAVVDVVAGLRTLAVDVVARRGLSTEVEAGLVLRRGEGPVAQLMPDEERDPGAPGLVERFGDP